MQTLEHQAYLHTGSPTKVAAIFQSLISCDHGSANDKTTPKPVAVLKPVSNLRESIPAKPYIDCVSRIAQPDLCHRVDLRDFVESFRARQANADQLAQLETILQGMLKKSVWGRAIAETEKQLSSGKELLAGEVPQTLSHQIQVLMKLRRTKTRTDDIKSTRMANLRLGDPCE